jgi:hypothetical protein
MKTFQGVAEESMEEEKESKYGLIRNLKTPQ